MNEAEELLAGQLYEAIQTAMRNSERSQQARDFIVGVSDLGTCAEYTRRMLAGIPEQGEQDYLAAFIGTAIGREFEEAVGQMWPEVVTQATVSTVLHGATHDYRVQGHPDLLFPWGVIDGKSKDGLNVPERTGPTRQQRWQRHLYAKAAHEAGYFAVPLEEVKTANAWIDRSAADKRIVVEMDTYSPEVIAEATEWLDSVYYAWEHDEAALKEPPRTWCEVACGHFADCRGFDSEVTGLIEDPWQLAAVDLYLEGRELAKQGERMKDEAKSDLDGVRGTTGTFAVSWSPVAGSSFTVNKKPSRRLNITPIK